MIGRVLGRVALHAWGLWGKAPGWHYQAVERWGARLGGSQPLEHTLVNGCRIHCDLTDHVQRSAYFMGAYEPVESFLLMKLLRPGMTFVDAGANFGQYTLFASTAVGPGGHVHAFEPVPAIYAQLAANVERNRLANVRLNRAALWHEPDELELGLTPEMRGNQGAFSVGVRGGIARATSPGVRFDDYARAQALGRVDLVKMDIEGAELRALEGMRATLARDRPRLFVEINRDACRRMGHAPGALWDLLAGELGYRGWLIASSAADCRPLSSLDGVARSNVLFHHDDLPRELTSGWNLKSVLRWATRSP